MIQSMAEEYYDEEYMKKINRELHKELREKSNLELLEFIKGCNYTCNAGPLENNMDFIELMKRLKEQALLDETGEHKDILTTIFR